jgi:hypothetical protein
LIWWKKLQNSFPNIYKIEIKKYKMIHVVFNEPDIAVLKSAIELDESLSGEVVLIKDDYSVGPLENIYAEEGIEARNHWWKSVLNGGDFEPKVSSIEKDDNETAQNLVNTMRENENEIIWIWAAQNKQNVSGYYWLLPFMKEFQGRVSILYLNNLPFINEKGNIFYPTWLSQIPAKEFLKAKKLAREITPSEFEVDPDEWTKLCNENKGVRILEGGKKLAQFDYDYYDGELKKYIMPDWQKAGKIINNFSSKAKETTSSAYLLWRLKVMLAMDLYAVQGEINMMKDFEIKYHSKED